MPMDTTAPPVSADSVQALIRQHEVERFLYEEAALLDGHRYEQWLELFADDATYFMPIRRTRLRSALDQEFTPAA